MDGIVFCSRHSQILRGITQKIYIQVLWYLRSAHCLMLVNISLTFREAILNGFQVSELQSGRIIFCSRHSQNLRGITQKIYIKELLMVAICTPSNVG